MPLNPRRRIEFYMDAKTLEKFLAKYPPERRHEIARQAFLDFLDGKTRSAQSEETAELRRRKLLLDVREKEEMAALRKRKLAAETAIAEYSAARLATVWPNPSPMAKAAMRTRTMKIPREPGTGHGGAAR